MPDGHIKAVLIIGSMTPSLATVIAAAIAIAGGFLLKLLEILANQSAVTKYKTYLEAYKIARDCKLTNQDDELWAKLVLGRLAVEVDRSPLHNILKLVIFASLVASAIAPFARKFFDVSVGATYEIEETASVIGTITLLIWSVESHRIGRRFMDIVIARIRSDEIGRAKCSPRTELAEGVSRDTGPTEAPYFGPPGEESESEIVTKAE